ncbi:MAG: DUF6477 family protein [Octadecabacter sp.]
MEDVLTTLSRLNRPQLLVRTARHGIQDYNRLVHLRRLLKSEHVPGPSQAIVTLLELEAVTDQLRQDGRGEYSVARHVEMIVALMCEARILKASRASRALQDMPPLHVVSNVQQGAPT